MQPIGITARQVLQRCTLWGEQGGKAEVDGRETEPSCCRRHNKKCFMWLFHTGIIQLQRQEFQIMNDSKGYLANCTLVYAGIYRQVLILLLLIFLGLASGLALLTGAHCIAESVVIVIFFIPSLPFISFAVITTLANHIGLVQRTYALLSLGGRLQVRAPNRERSGSSTARQRSCRRAANRPRDHQQKWRLTEKDLSLANLAAVKSIDRAGKHLHCSGQARQTKVRSRRQFMNHSLLLLAGSAVVRTVFE